MAVETDATPKWVLTLHWIIERIFFFLTVIFTTLLATFLAYQALTFITMNYV